MKYIFIILLADLILCEWSWGWCKDKKDVSDVKNINLTDFAGTWYEIMKTKDDMNKTDCISYNIIPTNEGNMNVEVKAVNATQYSTTWRKSDVTTHFKAEIEPFLSRIYDREYNIVNTDYKNYAVLYSCYNAGLAKDEYAWILSRSPNMDESSLNNMTNYLFDKFEIEKNDMVTVNQDNNVCKR